MSLFFNYHKELIEFFAYVMFQSVVVIILIHAKNIPSFPSNWLQSLFFLRAIPEAYGSSQARPTPQPEQHQIRAMSVTYTASTMYDH